MTAKYADFIAPAPKKLAPKKPELNPHTITKKLTNYPGFTYAFSATGWNVREGAFPQQKTRRGPLCGISSLPRLSCPNPDRSLHRPVQLPSTSICSRRSMSQQSVLQLICMARSLVGATRAQAVDKSTIVEIVEPFFLRLGAG
jgi:hypothetical protein